VGCRDDLAGLNGLRQKWEMENRNLENGKWKIEIRKWQ
jgi:hypothetical protein